MTPWKLYDLMREKKYLCWDFNVYTIRDRLRPVLKALFMKDHDGAQIIKLEYYQDTGCQPSQFLASEYLDAALSDEELLSIIDTRMRSDKWFEMPECFTGEKLRSLPLLVGSIKIKEWMGRVSKLFTVESAGYGASYRDDAGRCVSTETVFDICVPTEQLDIGTWYLLYFICVREEEENWRGFNKYDGNEMSLVLTAALGNWSFGISAYTGARGAQARDFYEIRYAPDGNGILFLVTRKTLDWIWFKAAWLKSEGKNTELCQQALQHWLEQAVRPCVSGRCNMDELTTTSASGLIALKYREKQELKEFRPFQRDILLFDTYIAGTSFIENIAALEAGIKAGDRLNFFREADNQYDANAIVVKTMDNEKIGYVPKKDNVVFSRLMDAGKLLFGTVTSKELKGKWVKIYIDIYLHE